MAALGMLRGSAKAPVLPQDSCAVLAMALCPSLLAGPAGSPGAGQWIFVQAGRLQANLGLNFPAEHIGICGVCDFWFGC